MYWSCKDEQWTKTTQQSTATDAINCGESGGVLKAAENTAVTVLFYSLECLHFVEDATGSI